MKKLIGIGIVLVALFSFLNQADAAAWTLSPSKISEAGHYVKWKVLCTSNGSALSATDLLPLMSDDLKRKVQGNTLMAMKVSPGTGGVIPDATIDIILSDDESDALFTHATISKDAITWFSLSEDINIYIPVTGKLYLTLNDIGTSGDQVTLYFITWKEDK